MKYHILYQLKSNENEVKYIDLRRKIEIKKMSNLMRNQSLMRNEIIQLF